MVEQTTRNQILEAATAVFAKKGFTKASMNDIMQAAGVSKGGIYWHFSSKDEIIATIFQQYFEAQLSNLDTMLGIDGKASDKMTRLARAASSDIEAFSDQFPSSLEFYELASKNEELRAEMETFFLAYRQHIELLAQQAIADGDWVALPPSEIANTILSIFEGTLLLASVFPDHMNMSTQMETAMNLLLNGLRNSS
ncbi:MAG: TetR/AcrR family transcriptional regulator [Anaerolineae bacterium]|nr:TetR/AcrR family transcriptional regulator [Anaerolineae bacterium]